MMVAACSGSLMMSMTHIVVRTYQVDRLRSMALVSNFIFLPLLRNSLPALVEAGDPLNDPTALAVTADMVDLTSSADRETQTVLVVDDDEAVLSVAAKVLSRGGYSVLSASGGHEALELAEAAQGQVSLLLSDLMMPEMSGRELGEIFEGRYPEIPILYMSAYTEDEVILQGLRFSEVNFMPKPFTVDGLLLKAREVIEQGEG
jgi:CheY-like chemotaxis protein